MHFQNFIMKVLILLFLTIPLLQKWSKGTCSFKNLIPDFDSDLLHGDSYLLYRTKNLPWDDGECNTFHAIPSENRKVDIVNYKLQLKGNQRKEIRTFGQLEFRTQSSIAKVFKSDWFKNKEIMITFIENYLVVYQCSHFLQRKTFWKNEHILVYGNEEMNQEKETLLIKVLQAFKGFKDVDFEVVIQGTDAGCPKRTFRR